MHDDVPELQTVLIATASLLGIAYDNKLYDFKLEQWGITREPGESFAKYLNKVCQIDLRLTFEVRLVCVLLVVMDEGLHIIYIIFPEFNLFRSAHFNLVCLSHSGGCMFKPRVDLIQT